VRGLPAWRARPDCDDEGCDIERARGRLWCRDHDPDRCIAQGSGSGKRAGRCRNRRARGLEVCARHQRSTCVVCRVRCRVVLDLCAPCLLELQRVEDRLIERVIVSRSAPLRVDPDLDEVDNAR
jgi:hypothetical protein